MNYRRTQRASVGLNGKAMSGIKSELLKDNYSENRMNEYEKTIVHMDT